nr:MAG TPA: hypothetical protein [Caudoviricetes sp.]DAX99731.1 MAG TPA: hypothetical protein [Caudoviricetes sp.]
MSSDNKKAPYIFVKCLIRFFCFFCFNCFGSRLFGSVRLDLFCKTTVNEFLCSLLGAFKNFIHRSCYIAVLPVVKCCCYSDFHSVTTFLNWSKSTGLNAIKKHSDFSKC